MRYDNLFYPRFVLEIGDYDIDSGVTAKVLSSKDKPVSVLRIKLNEEIRQAIYIETKQKVRLWFGYRNDYYLVFSGEITSIKEEIVAKDKIHILEKMDVSHNFRKATQEDIVLFLLKKAGIADYRLSFKNSARQNYFCRGKKGIEVIYEMQKEYADKQPFYCLDDIFYYGKKPVKQNNHFLEYGKNILSLHKTANFWEIETPYIPEITHSQMIYIDHPNLIGEYEIQEIAYKITEEGLLRTVIRGKYVE